MPMPSLYTSRHSHSLCRSLPLGAFRVPSRIGRCIFAGPDLCRLTSCIEIVVCSASTWPAWGQCSMWLHVLGACLQQGQSGLVSNYCAGSLFVAVIPQTWLHAQTWNILGTIVSALCTTSQSTRSHCENVSTPGQFSPCEVLCT